jgi:5-methylcytosine-specific restriction endonuclease McrA
MIDNIEKIHTFAERLLLGENTNLTSNNFLNELDYAVDHVHDVLKSKDEYIEYYKFELRLRLAMHFTPLEALNYDPENEFTRQELIIDHIVKYFERSIENATALAQTIIKILDKWELDRQSVTKYRDQLLQLQNYKCNHCKVSFLGDIQSGKNKYKSFTVFPHDKYKPYKVNKSGTTDKIEYMTPEVDHIKPVSALGDNNLQNLQVLCKLCNRAKSNILNVKTLNEIKYAGDSIEEIFNTKPSHIQKMLYFVISRSNGKCDKCKSDDKELTMRKIKDNAPFIRSNLQALCKDCLST